MKSEVMVWLRRNETGEREGREARRKGGKKRMKERKNRGSCIGKD